MGEVAETAIEVGMIEMSNQRHVSEENTLNAATASHEITGGTWIMTGCEPETRDQKRGTLPTGIAVRVREDLAIGVLGQGSQLRLPVAEEVSSAEVDIVNGGA